MRVPPSLYSLIARSQRVPPSAGPMINSATKRSSFFVALDCFAEPVIGRAFARPVGADPLARNDDFKPLAGSLGLRDYVWQQAAALGAGSYWSRSRSQSIGYGRPSS